MDIAWAVGELELRIKSIRSEALPGWRREAANWIGRRNMHGYWRVAPTRTPGA
jgi:hypothetical protein